MWRTLAIRASKALLSESVVTRSALQKLSGKTLQLCLFELDTPINIGFREDYLAFPEAPSHIDLRISASVSDLIALAKADDVMSELAQRNIRIEGDTSMLFALQGLADSPDISITPLFVPLLGFGGAQSVELAIRGLFALIQASLISQARQAEEWLLWESELLVTQNQFDATQADLRALQQETAALAQKISKLEK